MSGSHYLRGEGVVCTLDLLIDGGWGFSFQAFPYRRHLPCHILYLLLPKAWDVNLFSMVTCLSEPGGHDAYNFVFTSLVMTSGWMGVRSWLSCITISWCAPLASQFLYNLSVLLHQRLHICYQPLNPLLKHIHPWGFKACFIGDGGVPASSSSMIKSVNRGIVEVGLSLCLSRVFILEGRINTHIYRLEWWHI